MRRIFKIHIRQNQKTRAQRARRRRIVYSSIITLLLAVVLIYLSLAIFCRPAIISPEPPATAQPEVIVETASAPAEMPEPEIVAPVVTASPKYPLTPEQRDLLAAVAFTEAGIDGLEGMTSALFVVRNRLEDGRFGESIEEICIPSQFHGLRLYHLYEHITEDAYAAVETVFDREAADTTNGALFFCSGNPDSIKYGLIETAQIGRHRFYTDKAVEG